MKARLLLLVALALLLPGAAFADNIEELAFGGGTLSGDNSGLTLSGSSLTAESSDWLGYITGTNLGAISFTTNGIADGSAGSGAYLLPGGTVTITGNGSSPSLTGVVFAGAFTNATWSFWIDPTTQDYIYTLSGNVNGISGVDT